MDVSDILSPLNEAQRDAVTAEDRNLLVLAGAGSGKTRVLVHRIAWLIRAENYSPWSILEVTFTNKAAREMRNRIEDMLQIPAQGMWVGTFHGLAHRLLKAHWRDAGLPQNFQILDSDDQLRLVKRVCREMELDDSRWPPKQAMWYINSAKDEGLRSTHVDTPPGDLFARTMKEVYRNYEIACDRAGLVDFAELLLRAHELWLKNPEILRHYQQRFQQILVDEFQDTNTIQYAWLRVLAGKDIPVVAVGDDDQSIYGWRGAEVGNILRFETDFPGSHVVKLEQNYRSTPHILAAASGVIAGNEGRLGKTLWTDRQEGEKVRLIGHWDGEEEARWIGDEVEAVQRGTRGMAPMSLDHMAILVRASHQMRAFEDRFLTIGLPYRVIGGPRFYERMEIRDAMAYFRIVTSPDDDLAFERVVNTPKRGLGDKAQQKIQVTAREHGVNLVEGARILLAHDGLTGKGAAQLRMLVEGIARWNKMLRGPAMPVDVENSVLDDETGPVRIEYGPPDVSHLELAQIILDESGYTGHWQNDKTPEAPGRLENLKELVKALEQFENLQGFLEHVSLIMDNESDDGGAKVSIMTLHAAKGLEFPSVFLPGWEDGLFPSQRSMDESGLKGLEEERRLAYVGITRAEEICTISFAANRRVFGQWQSSMPSRFIDELPEADVEVLTPPGLYGGGFGAAVPTSTLHEAAADANVYNSPGWRRLQARSGERGMGQPKETRSVTIDMNAVSSFAMGERVFHQKFGYGAVTGIEGDKLEIDFEKAGLKKVVSKFVTGVDDVPF